MELQPPDKTLLEASAKVRLPYMDGGLDHMAYQGYIAQHRYLYL